MSRIGGGLIVAATILTLAACGGSPQEKEAKFLKRGKEFMSQKDYARALLEFRNAAAVRPRDAEPFYQMGVAALAAGNLEEAAFDLKRATDLNPEHIGAQLKAAELMTATRNKDLTQEAEKRLKQVLLKSPDDPEAIDTIAIAEYQLGKRDDAIKRLQDVLEKFPAHLQSAVALARLKLARHDLDGAEEILKGAVGRAPKSVDAALALGQFYLARGKLDLSERQISRALGLDPRNPSALLTLAAIQVNTNRPAEAEQTYKALSELHDTRYRSLHALFLFQQNRREEALAELKKIAEEDRRDRAARTRLVKVYALMNRIQEAESVLDLALKRNPKDQDALLQRGELYLENRKLGEAEKDFRQVLQFQPDSAEAHFALAKIYLIKGQVGNERRELGEAIQRNPELLSARLTLARSFIAARDAKAALEVLDRTPPTQINGAEILVERSWALLLTGNARDARACVNRVLKSGRLPDAVLQDGIIKLGEKDYAGARGDAEEVLQVQPENIKAVHLLADTYLAQKQISKAVDRVYQLASQRPNAAPLQMLLAQLLASNNNRVEARAAFEAAKKAAPQSSEADVALAGLDVAENHSADARQRLAGIVAREPGNVRALLLLAELESPTNESGAIARYRSVLAIDESNLIALNNLGYLLVKDHPDEALRFAQRALELAPDNADVQDSLGWVLYRKGLYEIAVSHLKTAFEKAPTPVRQFHLGMTYLKVGNLELGQQLIRRATEKDPNLVKEAQARGW
jgi:tetratricopeptide (TPR) repeat protein